MHCRRVVDVGANRLGSLEERATTASRSPIGARSYSTSPAILSGSRLVAMRRSAGAAAKSSASGLAASGSSCSRLSTTTWVRLSPTRVPIAAACHRTHRGAPRSGVPRGQERGRGRAPRTPCRRPPPPRGTGRARSRTGSYRFRRGRRSSACAGHGRARASRPRTALVRGRGSGLLAWGDRRPREFAAAGTRWCRPGTAAPAHRSL